MQKWISKILDITMMVPLTLVVMFVVIADTIKNIVELLPFACFILCPSFIIGNFWYPFAAIVWFGYIGICFVKAVVVLQDQYKCL
jgi:hypothetical protein